MHSFVTYGFFLALVLITLPQDSNYLKGNLSRNVINQTPSLYLKVCRSYGASFKTWYYHGTIFHKIDF